MLLLGSCSLTVVVSTAATLFPFLKQQGTVYTLYRHVWRISYVQGCYLRQVSYLHKSIVSSSENDK